MPYVHVKSRDDFAKTRVVYYRPSWYDKYMRVVSTGVIAEDQSRILIGFDPATTPNLAQLKQVMEEDDSVEYRDGSIYVGTGAFDEWYKEQRGPADEATQVWWARPAYAVILGAFVVWVLSRRE